MRVAFSFDDVSAADWSRLAKDRSPFQQEAWYRAAEASGALRIYLAEENGRPILALPVYRLDQAGHYYSSPSELLTGHGELDMLRDRAMDAEPLQRAQQALWYPAAVTMSPYGYRGGVLGGNLVDARQLDRFVRFVLGSCADDGIRVVSFHYLVEHEDTPLLRVLLRQGGAPTVLGASCLLPLPWATTEEYFNWLGRSRRTVRLEYGRADRAPGITWSVAERETPSGEEASVLTELFEETLRRHGETDPPTKLLYQGARGTAGTSVFFQARDPSGVRSALLAYRQGDVLYPKFFGSNVSRGHYFPLGYWHTLQYALTHRMAAIDFGGGATRAKLWRGAELYWDLGMFFFLDDRLRQVAEPMTRIMSAANHSYFTELAERWSHTHTAPQLPQGFDHLPDHRPPPAP